MAKKASSNSVGARSPEEDGTALPTPYFGSQGRDAHVPTCTPSHFCPIDHSRQAQCYQTGFPIRVSSTFGDTFSEALARLRGGKGRGNFRNKKANLMLDNHFLYLLYTAQRATGRAERLNCNRGFYFPQLCHYVWGWMMRLAEVEKKTRTLC